jgi:hypothetical protein
VVLRGDLRPPERELIGQYCWPIRREGGGDDALLQLLCTEIDLSHGYFLQMQTIRPDEEPTLPLSIPHHFVALILGADEDSPIGFLTDSQ